MSLILLSSASFAFLGCAVVGPRSISMGRADYNAAINKTEDEKMLMAIVKGRYGETTSLLSVNGVAANVRFNAINRRADCDPQGSSRYSREASFEGTDDRISALGSVGKKNSYIFVRNQACASGCGCRISRILVLYR